MELGLVLGLGLETLLLELGQTEVAHAHLLRVSANVLLAATALSAHQPS